MFFVCSPVINVYIVRLYFEMWLAPISWATAEAQLESLAVYNIDKNSSYMVDAQPTTWSHCRQSAWSYFGYVYSSQQDPLQTQKTIFRFLGSSCRLFWHDIKELFATKSADASKMQPLSSFAVWGDEKRRWSQKINKLINVRTNKIKKEKKKVHDEITFKYILYKLINVDLNSDLI